MAQGFLLAVSPCDTSGTSYPNASDPNARSLRFDIDPAIAEAPKEQLELKGNVELALSAIQRLYAKSDTEPTFRRYFVQIASAAQVGLVGAIAHPDVAKQALAAAVADLIDEEGGRVKNTHLRDLAKTASTLSAPALLIYAAVRLFVGVDSPFRPWMLKLDLHPGAVTCFMILLVGCFVGVVLSYAARTTVLALSDLVNPDVDRLRPVVRLAVSAGWTVIVGYLLALEVLVLQIGPVSSKEFVSQPMLAFLIGVICGLSNLTLPGSVMKKVSDILPK